MQVQFRFAPAIRPAAGAPRFSSDAAHADLPITVDALLRDHIEINRATGTVTAKNPYPLPGDTLYKRVLLANRLFKAAGLDKVNDDTIDHLPMTSENLNLLGSDPRKFSPAQIRQVEKVILPGFPLQSFFHDSPALKLLQPAG